MITPTVAHAAAGGGMPDIGPVVFFAGLLSIACVAIADRRRSLGEITAAMLFTQPALHVLFALSGHGTASVVPDQQMAVAHVVAAAALTVLLSGAENVVFALAALSETVLLRRVRTLLQPWREPARVPSVVNHSTATVPLYIRFLNRTAPRRGPPVVIGS